jgi:dienelactone hydrolase
MWSSRGVQVSVGAGGAIDGDLVVPDAAGGLVVFAHGSGSSRLSVRNRFVAERLQHAGLATLLVDLLTMEEEADDRTSGRWRFDIELLARRLHRTIDWAATQPELAALALGLFGASTGAAGALITAASQPDRVASIVCRGGRPDLAGDALHLVRAPTLLIVGSRDRQVIGLNQVAAERLAGKWRLEQVEGATHLFEEPGALERVAELATGWFVTHLSAASANVE